MQNAGSMLKLSSGQIARYGRGRFNSHTTASWWLARMVRTHAWNPIAVVRRLARLCELALHFRRHRKVVEVLSDPAFDGIRKRQPQLTIKYLNPRHLTAGLSSSDRASAMVHHYNYLAKQVDDRTRRSILEEGLLLWTHDASPGQHAIWLRFSHPTDNEGELSIDYMFDGRLIYILSFSFVPGVLFDVPTETAILVSRIQGTRSLFAEIRSAMKSMHGLGAPALLMSSLQGVAEGLGLTHILGVTDERQVSRPMTGNDLKPVYGDFFEALGATNVGGLHQMKIPLSERPIAAIKSSNRARARHQREFKKTITACAALRFSSGASCRELPQPTTDWSITRRCEAH